MSDSSCEDCGTVSLCDDPAGGVGNAEELRERVSRQGETIKALREELDRMKGTMLAPHAVLMAENEKLRAAIARQRKMLGEEREYGRSKDKRIVELSGVISDAIECLSRAEVGASRGVWR